MKKWYEAAENGSAVVSSRIRLVRNWKEYPFPPKMTKEQSAEMTRRLCAGLTESGILEGKRYRCAYLERLPEVEKTALLERRVLKRSVMKKESSAALLLSEDEAESVLINGDDHIRMAAMERGLCLKELYERVDRLDDAIGGRFDYAFDEKYGYLTTFPTNMGTGLRASAILHLPMLSKNKNFQGLVADMGRFGTLIRGVYGEGAENYGSLYQVMNQKTLGQSEQELVELVSKAAAELDAQEKRLRKSYREKKPVAAADEIYKSYGVLKYARRLTKRDAMAFLSQVMTGSCEGILSFEKPVSLYALMLGIQPANLLLGAERPLEKEELEAARAEFLRARLPELS